MGNSSIPALIGRAWNELIEVCMILERDEDLQTLFIYFSENGYGRTTHWLIVEIH